MIRTHSTGQKTKPRWVLKKAFFDVRHWILAFLQYDFLKIDKNCSQLSSNHFYVSYDPPKYTKRFPRLKAMFFICMTCL